MQQDQTKKNTNINKIKKDKNKKNNVETTLLLTQNTNVFSQLSANYLQTKSLISQQQQKFIKNTEIIQYHDPVINRILASLRKKAEITKIKAISEFKQYIMKMKQEEIQNFIPTFAYLYRQIILNEQTKQLVDQINNILIFLIQNFKKIVVSQISVLLPPIIVSQKLCNIKYFAKLFGGDQTLLKFKTITLFTKADVFKQFIILSKIILDNEDINKIQQPVFQRNASALLKGFKQLINNYDSLNQQNKSKLQKLWYSAVSEFSQLFNSRGIKSYLNGGGRPKAAILQLFIEYLFVESQIQAKKQWLAKNIEDSFLDKDINIQVSNWKYCNTKLLRYFCKIGKKQNLQKYIQKVFDVLKIGGAQMFKQLPLFIQQLPIIKSILKRDSNQISASLGFIRKLNQQMLILQDQNQSRLQSYCQINKLFISKYKKLRQILNQKSADQKQNKRLDESRKLLDKVERQVIEKLQDYYYKNPPLSRNSFSFYIPPVFNKLLNQIQILPVFKFSPPHTYILYKHVATLPKFKYLVDQIFNSRTKLQELIEYFEYFPQRPIKIDLEGGDINQAYLKCRLFHLTINHQQLQFKWSFYYNLFLFDPMLQINHLKLIQANQIPIFNNKLYNGQVGKFDQKKKKLFLQMLKNRQPKIKYFIPSMIQVLKRQKQSRILQQIIQIFTSECNNLQVPNILIIKNIESICKLVLGFFKTTTVQVQTFKKLNIFFQKYFWFIFYTYQKNMATMSIQLLDEAKVFRNYTYFQIFLQSLSNLLTKKMLGFIQSGINIQQKKQKGLKKRISNFMEFYKKVSHFLIIHRRRDIIIQISNKLFTNQFFKYGLFRGQIWQILYTILIDVEQEQLKSIMNQVYHSKNIQSIAILICSNNIFPLQSNLSLKRFFVQTNSTFLKPILLQQFQKYQQKSQQIIQFMVQKSLNQSLIYSIGLKNILKTLTVEHGQQININNFYKLTIQRVLQILKTSKNPQQLMRCSIFVKNLLPEFALKNTNQLNLNTIKLMKDLLVKQQYNPLDRIQFFAYADILSIYWNQDLGVDVLFQNDGQFINFIIQKIFKLLTMKTQNKNIYFEMQVLLNFLNVVIQKKTLQPFSDHLITIQKLTTQLIDLNLNPHNINNKYIGDSLSKLCQFIRKILPVTEAFSPNFKQFMIQRMLNLCKIKVKQYQLISQDIDADIIDENIQSVLTQFSQLISRFALVLDSQINQKTLIQLLGCRFPQIQKASFIVLKYFYQSGFCKNKLFALGTYFSLLQKQNKLQYQSNLIDSFSKALLWTCLFLRRQINQIIQQQPIETQQQIFQSNKIPEKYLNFLFDQIQTLNYDQSQKQFYYQPHQIHTINSDWSNYLNQAELFKLLIQSLFIFSSAFPMWLRLWVDSQKSKHRKNLCQSILKNLISDALFAKQVQKIQMRSNQWKTEHFQVFSLSKSKQISARYSKQNAVISLKLKIKNDYPLTPILIDYDHDLKIQSQLAKWTLKLKSLLYNQNNSIVNGIVLWKQNIDKQFQGIQQCAICYDIVNSQKQLPRMSCKTCRKKFHGACIRKWFTTSNKSECPLCKSQFL